MGCRDSGKLGLPTMEPVQLLLPLFSVLPEEARIGPGDDDVTL